MAQLAFEVQKWCTWKQCTLSPLGQVLASLGLLVQGDFSPEGAPRPFFFQVGTYCRAHARFQSRKSRMSRSNTRDARVAAFDAILVMAWTEDWLLKPLQRLDPLAMVRAPRVEWAAKA